MNKRYGNIHQAGIVIDAHCDTLQRLLRERYKLGEKNDCGQVDIPRALASGVTAIFFAACGDERNALKIVDAYYREIDANSDRLMLAACVADIYEAKEKGKLAGILSMEGCPLTEGELAILRIFYRLGVRAVGLVHKNKNKIAESVTDMPNGTGLTDFGVEVVNEMNRLGMICDVAHISPAGFYHVLEITGKPVISSHGNAGAICGHIRNLDDAQLKAMAQNGGVVGVSVVPRFVNNEGAKASFRQFIDHIEHIVKVSGIDHVGLGTDFDGFGGKPIKGLEDISCVPKIAEALIERGFSENDAKKVLGENYLRVIGEVW